MFKSFSLFLYFIFNPIFLISLRISKILNIWELRVLGFSNLIEHMLLNTCICSLGDASKNVTECY